MPAPAFAFVVACPDELRASGVTLKPFDVARYGREYWETTRKHPELLINNDGRLPEDTFEDLVEWVNTKHADRETMLWAILDSSSATEDIAGFFMLTHVSVRHLTAATDLLVLPRFQRTHVTTQACCLVFGWAFKPPQEDGLGLRRLEWTAYTFNEKSVRAAVRLGFQQEGIRRNDRPLDPRVTGYGRDIDATETYGQPSRGRVLDCVVLSLCWDDWRDGARDKLALLAARRPRAVHDAQ